MFFSDLTRLFSQIINVFHCYILKQDLEARVYIIQNIILFEFRNYVRNFFPVLHLLGSVVWKSQGFEGGEWYKRDISRVKNKNKVHLNYCLERLIEAPFM